MPISTDTIVVRRAVVADASDLERLAALDSARPPAGDVLLAEADGRIDAALELGTGRVVADPFLPTAAHVALLRTRAATLADTGRTARRLRRPARLAHAA